VSEVRLQVVLDAVDNMTAPVNKALGVARQLSPALKKMRVDIAKLNQQQQDIDGFKKLSQQMEKTDLQVDQSNRALSKLSQQISNTEQPTQSLLRSQERLERSHVKLLQKQESQKQSLDIYQKELKQSGVDVKALGDAEVKLQDKLKQTQQALRKQSSAYDKARHDLIKLNKAQKDFDGFKQLKNQLESNQVAFKHQTKEVARLQQRFDSAANPTQRLTNQLQKATDKLARLGLQGKQVQNNLQGLEHRLSSVGVSTTSLGDAQQQLKHKTATANAELQRQSLVLQQVTARQNALAQARRRMDRSLQTLSDISLIAGPSMQVGRGMVGAAAAPVKVAMSFEKEMSKVAALTRLDKGSGDYQRLEDQSRNLGATTSFKATEVAQGQQFMAMAGFDNTQIEGAMGGVLDLAKASGKDLARVADISSNILSGFGLKAEEMGRVGDVLTATFTRTNVDLGMLGYSMKYAAPIARTLGVSLEEAAAMSGLLGNVGIQGSQAGTSMRGIFNRLAAQPKPVAKALSALNINAKDKDNNLRPVIEILGDVAKATENMGTAERATHFKDIAGMEAGSAFAELVTQQGAEAIIKFVKVLEDSQGEARKVAQTMSDNLDGDMTTLSSAYQDAQISMGNIFLPVLREVVQWITTATRSIGVWIQENPKLVKVLTTVALVIGSVIAAMGGLALVMVAVLGPIVMIKYALTKLGASSVGMMIKKLGQSLFVLAKNSIPKAMMAIRGLNMTMLANPIGLMVMGIAAGAALIIYHWDKVKSFFSGFWDGLDLSKQFIDPFSRLIPSISNGFADAFAPLREAFEPLRPLFNWLSAKYDALSMALGGLFGSVEDVGKAGEDAGAVLSKTLLKDVTTAIFKGIHLLARAVKLIAPYIAAFVDGFVSGLEVIAPIVRDVFGAIGEILMHFATIALELLRVIGRIFVGIGSIIASVWAAVSPYLGLLGEEINALIDYFSDFFGSSDEWSASGQNVASALGAIAAGFTVTLLIVKMTQVTWLLTRSLWAASASLLTFAARLVAVSVSSTAAALGTLKTVVVALTLKIWAASVSLRVFASRLIAASVAGTAAYLSQLKIGVLLLATQVRVASVAILQFIGRLLVLSAASAAMGFSALISAFLGVGRAIGFMSLMLAANPIILVVGAIAGLAYLIYDNWDMLKAWMSSFWDDIKPYFSMAWEFIKELFSWTPLGLVITHWEPMIDWFKTLPATFLNLGSMIMDGLKKGISNGIKAVIDKVTGVANKIKSAFSGATEIKSPSRVFMRYGQYINEGLAVGLESNAQEPIKQTVKIAKMLPEGIHQAANDGGLAQQSGQLVKKMIASILLAGSVSLPLAAMQQPAMQATHFQAMDQSMQMLPPQAQIQNLVEQKNLIQSLNQQPSPAQILANQPTYASPSPSNITVNVNIDGSAGDMDEYRLAAIIRAEIEQYERESDYRRRTQQFDGRGTL